LVKTIKGREVIWEGGRGKDGFEECLIEDKSFATLTKELNLMFRRNKINKCIQKIAFLAETSVETGFFVTARELLSNNASSQDRYKGRGLLQLTWKDAYEKYQKKISGYNIITNPELVEKNVKLAIDSSGWIFSEFKTSMKWTWRERKKVKGVYVETEAEYKQIMECHKWKRENYSRGLNRDLNSIALLMEDEELLTLKNGRTTDKYFYLISRLLHGYSVKQTNEAPPTNLNYSRREENLKKLKQWFKFDKEVCKGEKELVYNDILDNPLFKYVKVAGSYIGILEGNNPVIAIFFKEIGHPGYTDKTAWCAAFANYCLKTGNPEIPRKDGLNAVSFSYSGYEEVETPYYGSFMVWAKNGIFYKSGSQGHVAIVVGKVGDAFAQLGGNQAKPGENEGTTVNVVLRKRDPKVKYFHPQQVPKIELGKPLFSPATKTVSKESLNSTR